MFWFDSWPHVSLRPLASAVFQARPSSTATVILNANDYHCVSNWVFGRSNIGVEILMTLAWDLTDWCLIFYLPTFLSEIGSLALFFMRPLLKAACQVGKVFKLNC